MKFTKFFPVESPVVDYIPNQPNNAGIDVFMPKVTNAFIEALLLSNEKLEPTVSAMGYDGSSPDIKSFTIANKYGTLIRFHDGNYTIHQNIQIPIGLGFLIPVGYYIDLRAKSSNFKNAYTSIKGLIDNTYTYSSSVQLYKLDEDNVIIKPDEKIAQFLLQEHNPISELNEVSLDEWNKFPEVIQRRLKRTGGYGTTGKFKADLIKVQAAGLYGTTKASELDLTKVGDLK